MKNKAKDKKSKLAAVSKKRVEKVKSKKKPLAKPAKPAKQAVSKKTPIAKVKKVKSPVVKSKAKPVHKKAKPVQAKPIHKKPEQIKSKPTSDKKLVHKLSHKLSHKIAHIDGNAFKGKKKFFFDLLMLARFQILGQLKFHSEEALETNAASGLAGSMSNHMADFGSDNFLHEMELDLLSNEGEVLEMIDEAIQRLESGEYGKCLDCGCIISEERLKVKPYARFCIKCKSTQESNGDISAG